MPPPEVGGLRHRISSKFCIDTEIILSYILSSMSKHESNELRSLRSISSKKKSHQKINLAVVKTAADFPIQELVCREEHKKLFEVFNECQKN